jgi:PAS domain S-box-containing protein
MLKHLARQMISQVEHWQALDTIQQLNQTLSETARFSKNVVDNIPASIGYWDRNLICKYANKTYAAKYSHQGIDVVGMALSQAINEELMRQIKPRIDEVFTGLPQQFEATITSKHGQKTQSQVNYIPDFDQDGNVCGFYIFAIDITALRLAEEESKLAEIAIESSSTAVLVTDKDHYIISVNEEFIRTTGYTQHELIGAHPSFIFDEKLTYNAIDTLSKHEFWRGDIALRKKNGDLKIYDTTVAVLTDQHGSVTHHVATIRDLTEYKKLQHDLVITQKMLERTNKIANVGGWEYDINSSTVRWSEQIYIIRELDTREPPTHEFALSFFPEEARVILNEAVQQCIEHGTPFDLELPLVTAKGNHIWVRTMGEVIYENGRKTKIAGVFQDISLRKRQAQLALNKEIELRQTVVREVHHHIKNNIQGLSGILHNAAHQHPSLSTPINEAISQLQSVAVIHGLQGKSSQGKIELRELTSEIIHQMKNIWQIECTLNVMEGWCSSVITKSEAVPIALILNELITNAIKHKEPGSHVNINLAQKIVPDAGTSRIVSQITIMNQGVFRDKSPQESSLVSHSGLNLVASLMPKNGAYLRWEFGENTTSVQLELSYPIVKFEDGNLDIL